MRTDQEALLHAYLNGYEKLQANTVNQGRKKISSGAATSAQAMNQTGRTAIPKSYDPVPTLVNMAVQQNKAERAEAERQRKAAASAAKKAQKEAEKQAEKDDAQKAAQERLARMEQAGRGAVKATPIEKQSVKVREDAGEKTAAANVNRQSKNEKTSSWWDNFWNGAEGTQNYTHRGSGRAPLPVTQRAAENSGAAQQAQYARMSFAEKQKEYLALLEQWQALEGQKQDRPDPNLPADTLYTQEEYDVSQHNAELAQRQKQIEKEFKALQKALEADPASREQQRQEAQARTLEDYLAPGYKLSDADKERARQIIADYYARNPLAEKARQSQGTRGMRVGLRQAFSQMSEAQKREYERIQSLQEKMNKPASFALNLVDSFPLMGIGLDKAGEAAGREEATSFSSKVKGAQTQNPLSSTAGRLAGTLLEYQAGSALMKRIPGVGKALDKAGQAVAGTRAAQALQQVPMLGHLATPEAVAGILGDQILDTTFDTIPSLARDLRTYNTQGPDGTLTGLDILGNTAGNVGFNLGMNLLGEGVQGILQNRARPVPALEAQNAHVATGAETVLDGKATIPTLQDNAAFKAVLDGDAEIHALTEAFENGTLTRAQIETLKPGGTNRAAFEAATGLRLPATSSETRRLLTAGPQMNGLDSAAKSGYSEIAGGANHGEQRIDLGAGVGGVEPLREGAGDFDVQGTRRNAAGNQRVFRQPVTDPESYVRAGATVQELEDTTRYPEAFCSALDEAIEKNKHGLMVSPKTPQELAGSGAITFMSKDGMCGAAVTADGDIEAVFRIPGGEGKRLSYQMVVTAVDNGGVKLDCYGADLAYNYSRMGFEPVARVRWNPDYAPDGWTYGPKDVYVMKLGDGLDADQVLRRMGLSEAEGGFHIFTDTELKALPEMDYDAALAYRDSLLPKAVPGPGSSAGKSLAQLDVQTASWDDILSSPEIRQAREQAKFDTPTIEINTPERQALRQQIADELMEMGSFSGKDAAGNELFTGPVRRERRADIVIGPPAAGKSSVLANPLSQEYGSRIIDSDMAKAKLPEFNGGVGASRVHMESAQISEDMMLNEAVFRGDNIVIPWVGKSPEKLQQALQNLKEAGYSVHLSLNELDPDKAARRAVARFQSTGRLVDPEYILDVGWKPSEVYDILKSEGGFDSYVRYSNDVPYGQPAKLIEQRGVVEEVQTGRVGGSGGRSGLGGNAESFGAAQTAEIGAAGVSSQGNQAAFSAPEIPAGMKERGYAESLRTGSDLPEEVKQAFIDQPEVYRQLSNAETAAKADAIMSQGLNRATVQYRELLSRKDPAAVPLGKDIADSLIAQGRREEAVQVLREMSEKLTQSGQFSQAAAITLMKNDPMTALQYIQKDIDKMNREGAKKFGGKWKDFVLTGDEIGAFSAVPAGDEAALKELFGQVGTRIAREYPATTWEKLVEASHIAMLLNPRTQTRNVLANVAIRPEQWFSRKLSAAGQNIVSWFKQDYQPNQALRVSRGSKDLAAQAYDSVKASLGDAAGGKWENTVLKGRADKEVFKLRGEQNLVSRLPVLGDAFNALGEGLGKMSQKVAGENVFKALSSEKSVAENLRQFTYGLLELGDEPFVRKNFVDRMASFIEARGYKTLDEVPPEAYDVAMQEALKATFKDDNAISQAIVSLKRTTGPFGEMLMPFTKTPANITARALDYSPVGLLRGIAKWVKNGGDPSGYIDEIAKGLTGTGLILLGAQLYKAGVITGPASENARQAAFDRQQGKLPYSIKAGDNYYTFDWAQPASMGLILGTTIAAQIERDGGLDAQSIAEMAKNAGVTFVDTLLEQSTLQNAADLFGGYGSFGENLLNETAELPQRMIPSLSGALARTADPVQRQTFSNGDVWKTQLDTLQSKIPFLSQNLPAAYDTWGNEIRRADSVGESAVAQLLSPGQLGNAATTPLDGEISRLFEATGEEKVFPRKADWSVTFNGVTHKLSNMDYAEYQKVMGQLSFQLADELMESPSYRMLGDDAKVETLSNAYDLARKAALDELYSDYSSDDKLLGLYQSGGAEQVVPYLLSDAELRAARQEKREETGNAAAALTNNETYAAVYGVPGLGADERAHAYLNHATNDKQARLTYHEQGADGLEAYLRVRSAADLNDNGSISKAELMATMEAAGLTDAQKAYYFEVFLPKAKNPYQ